MAGGVKASLVSFLRYVGLVLQGSLRLNHDRVGQLYSIEKASYAIFRETEQPKAKGQTVILVIGFRLKFIRSNPLLHWLFQRVCILTTPFWSGMQGFKVKLWMVNPATKDYLGIYDWRGKRQAQAYLDYLLPILNFCSVKGSVWATQLHGQEFETYLANQRLTY
ncbi:MAG TPA: hypothetical protein VFI84_02045 [Candidatus Saccharimonadales bacterium]|nr:hypothetical protein [Candidatus Saccharimonadales bacterium]